MRLGLIELGFRQLDVAGRDVVRHNQAGDEVGQVRLRELGAERDIPANHQTDLDLVVQELDVLGFDDLVEGPADRTRSLPKECERDSFWVHAGALDVRNIVCHLCHHAARGGDRRDEVEAVDRHGTGAVCSGVDGRPVVQQLTCCGGESGDLGCTGGSSDPPGAVGSKD